MGPLPHVMVLNVDADGIPSGHEELLGCAATVDADFEFSGAADDSKDAASFDVAVCVADAVDGSAADGDAWARRHLRGVNVGDEIPKAVNMDHFAGDAAIRLTAGSRTWELRPLRQGRAPSPGPLRRGVRFLAENRGTRR